MSYSHHYALSDISVPAPSRSVSRKSGISTELREDAIDENPFNDQDHNTTESQALHPYEPYSAKLSPSTEPPRDLRGENLFTTWGWELATWLLAAISLVTLIIVLSIFNNKGLHEWKSGLTPGGAVAILSQFGQTAIFTPVTACICQSLWLWLVRGSKPIKAANLGNRIPRLIAVQEYNDGSRGPIYNIVLLWKHPTSLLVWLGTINTVLIFVYGTFAQLTLRLPIREYNVTDPGSIPRSLQFRGGQPTIQLNLQRQITYESVPDVMNTAITEGLLRKNVSPSDLPGSCPTGNCTFEAYQSMGVCSNVIDVSSSITSKCPRKKDEVYPNKYRGCNYSVAALDRKPTATETNFTTSLLGPTLWIGASDTTFNHKYPEIYTLAQFYVIYVPDLDNWELSDQDTVTGFTKDHKKELIALQATLNLCLYTYQTKMTFGVTNTTQLSRITDLEWQTGSAFEDDGRISFPTVTTTYNGETFWMKKDNVKSFNDHLTLETFTGIASLRPVGPSGGGNSTTTDAATVITSSIYGDQPGIQGFSALMDKVAVSMTNGLRNASDLPATAPGTSSSTEVYIRIVWAWMIVPIATVLLSLIFLLLVMYLSLRHRVPTWRASLLAVMLSLGTELRSELDGIGRVADMEEEAKNRKIQLEAGSGQWKIVKAD